jgi:hypothetical protein
MSLIWSGPLKTTLVRSDLRNRNIGGRYGLVIKNYFYTRSVVGFNVEAASQVISEIDRKKMQEPANTSFAGLFIFRPCEELRKIVHSRGVETEYFNAGGGARFCSHRFSMVLPDVAL